MFQHRWSFKTGTSGNQNWSQEVFDHCAAAFPPETPKIKSVFDQYQKKKLLKLTVSLKNLKFHYREYGDTFIDTTDDASTLMQCESKDYFDVFYLRSNNAPDWEVTTGANYFPKDMWRRKVTPKTVFGFTMRADKRCNKWFTHNYSQFLSAFNRSIPGLAHSLDGLDFKLEYKVPTAVHADQLYNVIPRCFLYPDTNHYPSLSEIQVMFPNNKCSQSFLLTGDITITSTFALMGTSSTLLK